MERGRRLESFILCFLERHKLIEDVLVSGVLNWEGINITMYTSLQKSHILRNENPTTLSHE